MIDNRYNINEFNTIGFDNYMEQVIGVTIVRYVTLPCWNVPTTSFKHYAIYLKINPKSYNFLYSVRFNGRGNSVYYDF